MGELNKDKVGLSLGILSVVAHFLWMIAIIFGFTESILSWWKAHHFISPNYALLEFNILTAILGLITAFITAYIFGWTFALIYNKLQGGSK